MREKTCIMQSEVADEAVSFPEKMTFAKSPCFVPADQPVDPLEFCSTTIKIEDINLEDEIEKVEATSDDEDSSSNSEKISDVSINQFAIPLFSEIPEENPNESVKNWLKQISEPQTAFPKKNFAALGLQTVGNAPSRVVKYEDLPYMGEITLNNSKPRRGRKPKKADICHLIYKNYGTIFPGTPNANNYLNSGVKKESSKVGQKDVNKNSENLQNSLISSLLEKRLTQDTPMYDMIKPIPIDTPSHATSEPLNLCVRDYNPLKIRFFKNKKDNTYTSEIKSELPSDEDLEIVPNTPPSPLDEVKVEPRVPPTPDSVSTSSAGPSTPDSGANGPGGFVYWPNSGGVFLHPMALQQQLLIYQQLAANNSNFVLPSHSPRPPPLQDLSPAEGCNSEPPKKLHNLKKSEKTEHISNVAKEKTKRSNINVSPNESSKAPAKRKRSAIFIPPIPAENSTNPATEVSICKFKFTGGAKPSLQEKKMLSVDSGGNFRYYSGTGDKSMRGYEFFPREQLQQQVNNSQGSSTGAFLQASGEKIYPSPPVEFTGGQSTSDFLLNSEIPTVNVSVVPVSQANNSGVSSGSGSGVASKKDKKRKSRKSLQREKLEKTFKEKGFLIQTQQLESSEGATYCKFRQLKKFTRYLFRSWKDYLPGELQGQPGQGAEGGVILPVGEMAIDSTVDGSLSPSNMPSSSTGPSSQD